MKIAFVSHCGLRENSGIQISSIAAELLRRGHDCMVLVPDGNTQNDGAPFPVLSFTQAAAGTGSWPGDWAPDLVHAFTPREHVRRAAGSLQNKTGARLIVHMEDNEEQIASDLTGLAYDELCRLPEEHVTRLIPKRISNPHRYRRFLAKADGYTCLIDRLLDFKPEHVPGLVFWPGFDERLLRPEAMPRSERLRYGVPLDDFVVLYSGNIHRSNISEMRQLYRAVSRLRQSGTRVVLVKTGRGWPEPILPDPSPGAVIDLGFVERPDLIALLDLADVLVQPGRSSPLNDYRFPSKLPNYLASGRPVILPDTNIGRLLEDGRDALKLDTGTSDEIAAVIVRLKDDAGLRGRLGRNGREFALRHLTWQQAVDTLEGFYAGLTERLGKTA